MGMIAGRGDRRHGSALAAAALILIGGGANPSLAADAPQRGGTVISTLGADPPSINPDVSTGVPDGLTGCTIYQGLIELSAATEIRPMLAKSWTISPDGLTYRFDLVKANFHDGKPFTSEDVKVTLLEVSSKYAPQFGSAARVIDGIDTPAPDKAVIHLKQPYGPFLLQLACGMGAAILPAHLFKGTNPLQNPTTTTSPIGTGAFKLTEWKRGDHLTMVRNPDYWEPGKPYLDEVIFKVIPQPTSRTQALQAGEVDFTSFYFFPTSDQKLVANDARFVVGDAAMPPALDYMFINVKRKPFDDKRVRQALMMATDRDFLLRNVWFDKGRVGLMPFTSALKWAASPDIDYRKMYPFDAAKANAMLDAAGLPRGADGNRFQVHFVYASDDADYAQVATAVKSMWRAVGVDVLIEPTERATAVKRVYTDHDFDVTLNGYTSFGDPAIGLARSFVTSSIGKPYANASSYSNPAVDDLFAKGESLTVQADRVAAYNKAEVILADDLPVITLREKALLDVASRKLHNYADELIINSWRNSWLEK